jgi:TPR repeat protein
MAVEWYHKVASQGYAPAQVDLGLMFTVGRGVKRNYATAIEWFTKAANAGYASGQFYLDFVRFDLPPAAIVVC